MLRTEEKRLGVVTGTQDGPSAQEKGTLLPGDVTFKVLLGSEAPPALSKPRSEDRKRRGPEDGRKPAAHAGRAALIGMRPAPLLLPPLASLLTREYYPGPRAPEKALPPF